MMGVMVGVLRGMGYSFIPMAITIGFVCGFRVIWLFTVFAQWPTLEVLYMSYPITWGLAAFFDGVCYFLVRRHLGKKRRLANESRPYIIRKCEIDGEFPGGLRERAPGNLSRKNWRVKSSEITVPSGTRRSSFEIDMTNGPLVGKIVRFAVPLAISGILQLLFNAADIIVVGQFVGPQALAAVGSTSALIQLIVNLFIGLSIGVNVLVARYYGAGQSKDLHETVHTSVLVSLICGVILIFVGIALSRPLLELMGTPEDVVDQAVLYMRIYFAGMPVMMLYNFGSAILRAVGDTQRPLYFLFIAGIINVILNLFFVIVFHMGVEGVAIPTVISQCVSAVLVLLCLMKSEGVYRVELKKLTIHRDKLWQMTKIGIPAGIQSATFSISNVLIQSSINSFGSIAMAGSTAGRQH